MNCTLKDNLIFCAIASCYSICIHSIICVFTYIFNLFSPKREVPDENDYIRKYLDSYLKKDKPGFAVFINGPWGSGKTFFINGYKTKIKQKIYVSLFGIENKNEFEFRIWKGMIFDSSKISLKILNFIIVFVIIVIIGEFFIWRYGDNISQFIVMKFKYWGNLTLTSLKEIILFYFSTLVGALSIISAIALFIWKYIRFKAMERLLKKCFLILDDFERVEIPSNEVLSWINEFVEHVNIPIIIIGNEKAIYENIELKCDKEKVDEEKKHYEKIKEKTIGREFKFEQTEEKVCKKLIEKLSSSSSLGRTIENNLEWFVSEILEPLKKEPYKHQTNYRVLGYCFSEFDNYFNNKAVYDKEDWSKFVADEKHWKELIARFISFIYLKKIRIIPNIKKETSSPSSSDDATTVPNPSLEKIIEDVPDLEYSDDLAKNLFNCDLYSDNKVANVFYYLYPVWYAYSCFLPVRIWYEINNSKGISKDVFSLFVKQIINPNISIFEKWADVYYLDDENYLNLLDKTEEEFISPTVQSIEELIDFIKNICIAFEKGNTKLKWNKTQLKDKLERYVCSVIDKDIIKQSLRDDTKFYELKNMVNDKTTMDKNPNSLFITIQNLLLEKMKTIHNVLTHPQLSLLIEQIRNNPHSFVDWYNKEKRVYKDFFTNQDPEELWSVLEDLSTYDFRKILECLRFHIMHHLITSELDFWKSFIKIANDKVVEWKNDNNNIWKCDYLVFFCEQVEKIILEYERIAKSSKNNKAPIKESEISHKNNQNPEGTD